jgi:ADP-heptose:LPS heptosyltransferase
VSSADDKNPPAQDRDKILAWICANGFAPVELSSHMNLERCVRALIDSAFFCGVDSRLAHLGHMTGTPENFLQYRLLL